MILIILAVISINSVFGEDGLIASAERGSIEHTHAMVWEAMEMEYSNYWIDKVMLGGNLITYLQGEDKGIIGQELKGAGYVINVEKLLGNRMSLGNGTDGINDVYKLEEVVSGTKYSVKYYGPSGDKVLGILGDNVSNLIESDNPNFEITKEVTSKPIKGEYYTVGDIIEYTITAKNTGDVTIKDIKITDELTAGSGTYKPGDGHLELLKEKSSTKVGAENGYWTISSLDSQEIATICYTYTVQQKDIETGKIIVNEITELAGDPQPTVPRGHKIPKKEVTTVPKDVPLDPESERVSVNIETHITGTISEKRKAAILYQVDVYPPKGEKYSKCFSNIFEQSETQTIKIDNIQPGSQIIVKHQEMNGTVDGDVTDAIIPESDYTFNFNFTYEESAMTGIIDVIVRQDYIYDNINEMWNCVQGESVETSDYGVRVGEKFDNLTKHIVISIDEMDRLVAIRVRAIYPDLCSIMFSSDMWTDGRDGYYYYNGILEVGETSSEIVANIIDLPDNDDEVSEINGLFVCEIIPAGPAS